MTLEGIGLIKEAKNFLVDLKSCCSFGDLKEYYEKLTFLYQRDWWYEMNVVKIELKICAIIASHDPN